MKIASLPGAQLAESDYERLARCFILRELADAAFLRRVTDAQGRELIGINGRRGDFSGIVYPYVQPANGEICEYRLRRDYPDLEDHDGMVIEKNKYMTAPGSGNRLYFVPGTRSEWLSHSGVPVVIVEGPKKALALWAVAWQGLGDAAERPRFVPIGLSGVWSWRGRTGKAPGPNGSRRDVYGVIADLRSLKWQARSVRILFDANVYSNQNVRSARQQFAGWLTEQGASVQLANLPPEEGVNGPDDAAAKHGSQYILDILDRAPAFESYEPSRVLTPEEEELVGREAYSGWLRDYACYARSRLPQVPIDYHILTAFILAGGVLAARLQTDSGLRPNLAGVIVALQGSGKSLPSSIARQIIEPIEDEEEHLFKSRLSDLSTELESIKGKGPSGDSRRASELKREIQLLERAGRPAIIIATQASVEGLLEALSFQPCGIADFDEFGAFLKDCRRDHMHSARENLIKALDGRPIFYRRARGESVDVRQPALSLWGTVNVESLRLAASDEDMFGGFFSRILFCAPDYDFEIPLPRPGNREQAEQLSSTIRHWRQMGDVRVEFGSGALERAMDYAYAVAPFSKGDRVDITKPEDQVAAVAYVRYGTHVQKVAVLIAASEHLRKDSVALTVTVRHVLLAIALVENFRRQALRLLRHLETRDPLMVDAEKLLAKIQSHPGRERAYYHRLMHWPAERFSRALAEIERAQLTRWDDEQTTGGRKRRIYFPRQ